MATLKWISSAGGPLILVPSELKSTWNGVRPPTPPNNILASSRYSGNPDAAATDYDRACDVRDRIGWIGVGDGAGLVLNDLPYETSVYAVNDTLAVVIRIVSIEADEIPSDEEILSMVSDGVPNFMKENTAQIDLYSGNISTFDSGLPGDVANDTDLIEVSLRSGTYTVNSFTLESANGVTLLLHKLQRLGDFSLPN